MKRIIFSFFLCMCLSPLQAQLFSLAQIEEIQEYYLDSVLLFGGKVNVPYDLPTFYSLQYIQRPENYRAYYPVDPHYQYMADNTLRDTLKFKNRDILIFDSPLLDYEEILKIVLPNRVLLTGFWRIFPPELTAFRGYTAQWNIRNDSLFLVDVNLYHRVGYFWGDTIFRYGRIFRARYVLQLGQLFWRKLWVPYPRSSRRIGKRSA